MLTTLSRLQSSRHWKPALASGLHGSALHTPLALPVQHSLHEAYYTCPLPPSPEPRQLRVATPLTSPASLPSEAPPAFSSSKEPSLTAIPQSVKPLPQAGLLYSRTQVVRAVTYSLKNSLHRREDLILNVVVGVVLIQLSLLRRLRPL